MRVDGRDSHAAIEHIGPLRGFVPVQFRARRRHCACSPRRYFWRCRARVPSLAASSHRSPAAHVNRRKRNAGWAACRGQSRAGRECLDFVGRALSCADQGRCRRGRLAEAAAFLRRCAPSRRLLLSVSRAQPWRSYSAATWGSSRFRFAIEWQLSMVNRRHLAC